MDAWLKAFWAKLNTNAADLWKNDKLFLIIFGVIIVALKFRNVLIDLLISSSKSIFNSAKTNSQAMDAKEADYNKQATDLVEHAEKLNSSQEKVTDDWNTK